MNTLENYERDDIYVKSLSAAFDKFIELDKEIIENLLELSDVIEIEEIELPSMTWKEIYKSKNDKLKQTLLERVSFEISQNHRQYLRILKRFIQEHLKFPKAITFTLKNQIRNIRDVINGLETDYFKNPESEYDEFIFSFRDIGLNLLDELIDFMRLEYSDYLKDSNLEDMSISEIEEDGLEFNTTASKIVLMYELGLITKIKEDNPRINISDLSKVLSKITGTNSETIRRGLNDMNTSSKNNPLRNENTAKKVESLFNLYGINKKGD